MPTSKWAEPCLCEAIVNWREKDLKKVPCDSYSRDLGHGGMAQAEGLHQINMGILYEKLPESMYGPGLPRSPKWDGDVNSCVPGYGMLWDVWVFSVLSRFCLRNDRNMFSFQHWSHSLSNPACFFMNSQSLCKSYHQSESVWLVTRIFLTIISN